MRLLHTSDWHVGKTLKGRNRLDEQRKVIGQIIEVAREHQPDAILIAGDLYDVSAPSAESQQLVVQALLAGEYWAVMMGDLPRLTRPGEARESESRASKSGRRGGGRRGGGARKGGRWN